MDLTLGARDLALLRDFLDAMGEAGTKCFLVGAGARVLGFDRRWGLRGGRTTVDWDFAVRVESWEHWEALRARLLQGSPARFRATEVTHRPLHTEGAALDLLPYGDLESPTGEILWPGHSRMSALGLCDSEDRCELVDVGTGLTERVSHRGTRLSGGCPVNPDQVVLDADDLLGIPLFSCCFRSRSGP